MRALINYGGSNVVDASPLSGPVTTHWASACLLPKSRCNPIVSHHSPGVATCCEVFPAYAFLVESKTALPTRYTPQVSAKCVVYNKYLVLYLTVLGMEGSIAQEILVVMPDVVWRNVKEKWRHLERYSVRSIIKNHSKENSLTGVL